MSTYDSEGSRPSKTQLKQKMHALQQLGIKLCALNEAELHDFDLPENLLQAILEAKRLKSHGAMRRQAQYIGKIMRTIDCAPIEAAYLKKLSKHQQNTIQFHKFEQWRDRLLAKDGHGLKEFTKLYPDVDLSQLELLIDQAIADRIKHRNTGATRRLLQFLRTIIK